jgi:hypothetical protein
MKKRRFPKGHIKKNQVIKKQSSQPKEMFYEN